MSNNHVCHHSSVNQTYILTAYLGQILALSQSSSAQIKDDNPNLMPLCLTLEDICRLGLTSNKTKIFLITHSTVKTCKICNNIL